MRTATMAALLAASAPAFAQQGAPIVDNMVGLAVVFPPDTEGVRILAQRPEDQSSIVFVDDGSTMLDRHGDGEWWAMIRPTRGTTSVVISGVADGARVWHEDSIIVPSAWMSMIYPVTYVAERSGDEWTLARQLSAAMPKLDDSPTGAGIGGQVQALGLPPAVVYLLWGALALALAITAVVRSAILQVRDRG